MVGARGVSSAGASRRVCVSGARGRGLKTNPHVEVRELRQRTRVRALALRVFLSRSSVFFKDNRPQPTSTCRCRLRNQTKHPRVLKSAFVARPHKKNAPRGPLFPRVQQCRFAYRCTTHCLSLRTAHISPCADVASKVKNNKRAPPVGYCMLFDQSMTSSRNGGAVAAVSDRYRILSAASVYIYTTYGR